MKELKYTIIKTEMQYDRYCHILEKLVVLDRKELADEIDLLTLLIEKWDSKQNIFNELDPIELIKALMTENHLRARDLVEILGLSKGTVSKILNYQKGLSKGSIRTLSQHFKVSQEAFNKSYELVSREKNTIQKAS
jgi:HTH-type transcriptional regulator/antitoxin HigA